MSNPPRHPWFRIWIYPRQTIREILNYNPRYLVIPLALLFGFANGLERTMSMNMGDKYHSIVLILFIFVVGPLGGLVAVYLNGAIFSWVGRFFGGRGSQEKIRAALAWSSIPRSMILPVSLIHLAVFGTEEFSMITPRFDAMMEHSTASFVILGIITYGTVIFGIVTWVWSGVLMINCIAEVHRISAWRSLATIAIPYIFVLCFFLSILLSLY